MLRDSVKYHLGYIALFTVIRVVLGPVQMVSSKIYQILQDTDQKKFLNRFFQACCFPFLYLHYKFLRYISNDSFISLSMWSYSFLKASKKSYFLMKVRNFDRGVGNDKLISFILFQVKMSVALIGSMFVCLYQKYVPRTPTFKQFTQLECFLTAPLITFFFAIPFVSVRNQQNLIELLNYFLFCNFSNILGFLIND